MLKELQKQLHERFSELGARRREFKYPVYAIEHGLDELTLKNARTETTTQLRASAPLSDHWLVWIALAAEAGYTFSDDEYWKPFEGEPGQWVGIERRRTLRSFYEKFCGEYGGPKPVGRWATHFNIISWPIANAILPTYLQQHFAKHLYDLRHKLAHQVAADCTSVGQFLLDAYDGPSQRFRDFLQQTDLTSQIVLALRDQHLENVVPRIDPNFLARIVGDLERREIDRTYLRDARKVLSSSSLRFASNLRPSIRGQSPGGARLSYVASRTSLVARRQGDGSFVIGIRLPDIRAILEAGGVSRDSLGNARVRFAERLQRPEPVTSLLSLKERRLDSFPAPRTPLFILDQAPNDVCTLLEPASRIEESRVWLLKRQVDGLYQEVLHSQVRAGHDYLLLTRTRLSDASVQAAGLSPVTSTPREVFAYRLSAPLPMPPALVTALGAVGVGSANGISIEAAGVSPATSEETGGLPAWTSTEIITLHLRAEVKVTAFQIALDGQAPQSFNSGDGSALVELGQLDPGRHEIAVSRLSRDGSPTAPETFAFEIFSPRPWPLAMRERSGFKLQVQPSGASLMQLTAGEAALHIIGPAGRIVRWSLELYDTSGQFTGALRVGDTKIGDQVNALHSMLEVAFRDHAEKIDDAPRIDVVASLDELGRQAQSFSHPVDPLRWKFDAARGIVRLIDETDHAQAPSVRSYPFAAPIGRSKMESAAALQGIAIEAPGALFEAISGDRRALLFASPRRGGSLYGLSSLSEPQSLEPASNGGTTLFKLVNALRRWKRAVAVGQLALLRKQTTLSWLEQQVEVLACGADFSNGLHAAANARDWERIQKSVGGSPGFGYRMRTFTERTLKNASPQLLDAAVRYAIDGAEGWSAAAATLAFSPMSLRAPEDVDRGTYFETLLSKRTLLRGAFLARAASRLAADGRIKETA